MMNASAPPTLFHYTTVAGLLGILTTRKFWASHAKFLNDASEFEYGLSVVRKVLSDYKTIASMELPDHLLGDIRSIFFVTCFCEDGDLLSQWRGYTAEQTGYCIGISSSSLSNAQLMRVIYTPKDQIAAIREVIEETLSNPRGLDSGLLRIELETKLLEVAIQIKHPGFSEEREWRILVEHVNDWRPGWGPDALGLRYRPSKRFIIPYLEYSPQTAAGLWSDIPVLDLKSIRIGPTSNPHEAREALQWLLWQLGYKTDCKILTSETPVRP